MRSPHDRPASRTSSRRDLGSHPVGDRPPCAMGGDLRVRPSLAELRRLLRTLTPRPEDPQARPHPTQVRSPWTRAHPRMHRLRARGRIHCPPAIRGRPSPPRLRPHPRAHRPAERPRPRLVWVRCDTQRPCARRGRLRARDVAPLERQRARPGGRTRREETSSRSGGASIQPSPPTSHR